MKKIAYVIIHGFGGIPKDIESIKKQLIKNKIDKTDIYTPLLKGHGIKGKIDVGTKYQDIIDDLVKYINSNCNNYEKIYLIGYSMGGLIALGVSINIDIEKIILLNAPMQIWNFKNFLWTIATKNFGQKVYHIKTFCSSFRYNKVRGSIELRRLQNYVRNNMKNIKSDVYIVQSKHDYVAKPISANEIYEKIGSKEKKIKWYDNTTHYMPSEDCIDSVINDALNWTSCHLV